MMGWMIAFAIVSVLAYIPLGVGLYYGQGGPWGKLLVGPVKIKLFPKKKKAENTTEKPSTKKDANVRSATSASDGPPSGAPVSPNAKRTKQKKEGSLMDFLPLVDIALDLLASFGSKLRVNNLLLHLTLAADDPCDLAIHYGRAQAAVAGLMARLNDCLIIKRQDVQIQCDFTAEETAVTAQLDMTITLGRLASLLVVYGFRALMNYMKIKNQRQGGAVK